MKKILLFILMFATIFTLGACKKKEATPRTMDNFLTDFTLSQKEFEDYERIIKNEKGPNKFSYLNKFMALPFLRPKNKTIINSISITVYNHSESDYSFYIYDPNDVIFTESDGVYYMGGFNYDNKMELKSGEERELTFNVNLKVKASSKTLIILSNLVCPREGEVFHEDAEKIKENGGMYNFKVDYSVYL